MHCVNAAIPLMAGKVEVCVGTGSDIWIPAHVRAEMRLSPTPSVFLTFPDTPPAVVPSLCGPGQETLLRLPGGPGFRARTVKIKLGQSASSTVMLLQMPVTVLKTGKDLLSVCFDIINFPTLYHSVTLTAAPWQIEIHPREQFSEIVKQLNSDGGYGLTHVGTITRLDGQTFTADDAQSLLRVLWWFLSFARGGSCGVALASGIDENGETAWKQWGCRSTFRWGGPTAWLPRRNIHLLNGQRAPRRGSRPEAKSGLTYCRITEISRSMRAGRASLSAPSGAWGVPLKRRRASRSCFLTVQTIGRSKPICNRWLARAALERPRPPRTAGNGSRTAARLPGGRTGSAR